MSIFCHVGFTIDGDGHKKLSWYILRSRCKKFNPVAQPAACYRRAILKVTLHNERITV